MKAFFSSPYRSHLAWPDRHRVIMDTVMAMHRLRPLRVVWHWREVAEMDNVIWSPLPHGEVIRANIVAQGGQDFPEPTALGWCRWVLAHGGFTHNVQCVTVPRQKERNGMDVEREDAVALGLTVLTDIDVESVLR